MRCVQHWQFAAWLCVAMLAGSPDVATAAPLTLVRTVLLMRHGIRPATSILVGHDTNQGELAGLLHMHWRLGGYPADDPPPGLGIVFSLLAGPGGKTYVTATYQVQTMAQMRQLSPLSDANAPARQALAIPGCGNSTAPTACTLPAFIALVRGL